MRRAIFDAEFAEVASRATEATTAHGLTFEPKAHYQFIEIDRGVIERRVREMERITFGRGLATLRMSGKLRALTAPGSCWKP